MTRITSKILLPFVAALLASLAGPAPGKGEAPAGLTSGDWQPIESQIAAQQPTYVKASNTDAYDNFGLSVAVSGDTVVVGARYEDSSATAVNGAEGDNSANYAGAAYVFVRDGAGWIQQAYLKAFNAQPNDHFGNSVAISGDTIVVGAWRHSTLDPNDNPIHQSGGAHVFTRIGTVWTQHDYLVSPEPQAGDYFGSSVAISGHTIVVGAYGEDGPGGSVSQSGAIYVFEPVGGDLDPGDPDWDQGFLLRASEAEVGERFGSSVAISGDTIVAGAPDERDDVAFGLGAAYVFARAGGSWFEEAVLKASDRVAFDRFGSSVGISGDTIVVGAVYEDSNATGVNGDPSNDQAWDSGAAYVFQRNFDSWEQQAYLKASNTAYGDFFGSSVAISGDTIVIGAGQEDSKATGIDGDQGDSTLGSLSGAAYVFTRSGGSWSQTAYLKASNTGAHDLLGTLTPEYAYNGGSSVAISGSTIVAGAYGEDSAATGVNGDQGDDFTAGRDSGAAYIYDLGIPLGGSP